MNFQPPDPPEYGHCLTCKTSIHQDEVRGDHCIECEPEAMTTNQTIGGVPRELLADLADYGESGKVPEPWMVEKLRALLAAPEPAWNPHPDVANLAALLISLAHHGIKVTGGNGDEPWCVDPAPVASPLDYVHDGGNDQRGDPTHAADGYQSAAD